MPKEYSDCYYCGGPLQEHLLPRELRWKGQLFVFEDVPTGVCAQCGKKFVKPETAKAIDRVLTERRNPTKTIQVPVYQYEPTVA